ncbi:MAG: PTS sugar transporter subunit IIA, partial [Treponema sp.]|nr:PTS sugar transporter subunit IIA [Treponema sp.]
NGKGALRIGMGMISRGEMVLILASIGLASGILNEQLFAVIILMTLVTTLAAPPLMSATFKIAGTGTRKAARGDNITSATWEFSSEEIAGMVIDTLLKDLHNEGFYIQAMSIDEGLSQARKGDISLFIKENGKVVTIDAFESDMPFVKTAVYEVIVELYEAIHQLKQSADPHAMKKELLEMEDESHRSLLSYINPECTVLDLQGETKEAIIVELVDILAARGKLCDRDAVLRDVWEREKTMNTGMEHGIALPHAKTDGVDDLVVAVGIKKAGVDFGAMDGEKSRIFILMISPKKAEVPYLEFLAAISSALHDEVAREAVINAPSPEMAVTLLREGK